MKAFSKVGLLSAVALLAAAAMATSAQAVITINPAGAQVTGTASNPTLTYGAATVTCETGGLLGNTADPATDRIRDIALEFFGNCAVAGVGSATTTCQGFVTLIAQNNISATNNPGTLGLNAANEPELGDPVFRCDVATALCTITVQGPQNTADGSVNLNEDTDMLTVNVMNVQASRVGNSACGPASGTASFQANYAVSPSNLTFDGTP